VPDDYLAALSYEARERYWSRVVESGGPEFVYIAEDESGQIVGFASGRPEGTGNRTYRGELRAIYILEQHQRKGIGRRLTLAVAERLAQVGIHSMLVWVLPDNPACRFYEALGAREVGRKQIEIGGTSLEEIAYGWMDSAVARASN